MHGRHYGRLLALASLVALAACGSESRDRERESAQTAAPTSARTDRIAPAVAILSIDVDCGAAAVFFERGSAQLDDADREHLRSLAACLRGTPEGERVEITGMSAPDFLEPYDDALAAQRATNVASFLRLENVREGSFEIRAIGDRGAVAAGIGPLYPAQRAAVIEAQDPEEAK